MNNSKYPLIIVWWDDVSSYDGWREVKESQKCKPFKAKMVGWEIARNKKEIVLATAFSGSNECNGRRVIPTGCIRKLKRLQ